MDYNLLISYFTLSTVALLLTAGIIRNLLIIYFELDIWQNLKLQSLIKNKYGPLNFSSTKENEFSALYSYSPKSYLSIINIVNQNEINDFNQSICAEAYLILKNSHKKAREINEANLNLKAYAR